MELDMTMRAQQATDKWNKKFTHPKVLRSFPPCNTQTYEQSMQAPRGSSERDWWDSMARHMDMPMRAGWRQSREKLRARGLAPEQMHVSYRDQPDWGYITNT